MTGANSSFPVASASEGTVQQTNEAVHRHGLQPLVLLLLITFVGLFVCVCIQISGAQDLQFDKAILLAFRTPGDLSRPIGPSWILQSAIDLSALGGFTFIWLFTAATGGFLILVKRWSALGLFLVSIVGVSLLNAVIKISFHRVRPEVVPHLAEVSNASFPSGHAMISAATYLTIGAMLSQSQPTRRARGYLMTVSVITTLMIGVSRLYLGVHWPSDVLAGWMLGSAWALGIWGLTRKIEPISPSSADNGKSRDISRSPSPGG